MEKKNYYVSVGTGEISQIRYDNNDAFVINATEEEVSLLRRKLENLNGASIQSFWRAHVPIKPYHEDKPNDDYDSNMKDTFQMLYDWGDEQTKAHITSMGILTDNHM
ncbi:hydrolase [Virgibacillus ainsalahensis]